MSSFLCNFFSSAGCIRYWFCCCLTNLACSPVDCWKYTNIFFCWIFYWITFQLCCSYWREYTPNYLYGFLLPPSGLLCIVDTPFLLLICRILQSFFSSYMCKGGETQNGDMGEIWLWWCKFFCLILCFTVWTYLRVRLPLGIALLVIYSILLVEFWWFSYDGPFCCLCDTDACRWDSMMYSFSFSDFVGRASRILLKAFGRYHPSSRRPVCTSWSWFRRCQGTTNVLFSNQTT